ncbi:AmmeMemoRadiSam system protein B [Melioribacteraceae bacterium 4301-Me]|uniref:AmmeMemoRadiSam system protein B n=1 Tax=Pyranulibacter aquaticus TaxID=3163344 RepID=UPI00359668B6
MKTKYLILFPIFFILSFMNTFSQTIRPIRDNVGFCWKPDEMTKFVNYMDKHFSDEFKDSIPGKLIAGISPHDDYLYAGRIYYPLYKLIRAKEVVIFGVTHGTVRNAMNDPKNVLIFDDFSKWHGPFKDVQISPLREKLKLELDPDDYMVSDKAQMIEHSIEALIPFLQYYNRDVEITPIMVTAMSYEKMEKISDKLADIIIDYIKINKLELGKDIFFLISTDANHYGKDFENAPFGEDQRAHEIATERDEKIAKEAFNGEISKQKVFQLTKEIWPNEKSTKPIPIWCGRYPIVMGLLTINNLVQKLDIGNLYGKLLIYSDTVTEGVIPIKGTGMGTTAPFSYKHWVGFFSSVFFVK